jgi:hypothetical protein
VSLAGAGAVSLACHAAGSMLPVLFWCFRAGTGGCDWPSCGLRFFVAYDLCVPSMVGTMLLLWHGLCVASMIWILRFSMLLFLIRLCLHM